MAKRQCSQSHLLSEVAESCERYVIMTCLIIVINYINKNVQVSIAYNLSMLKVVKKTSSSLGIQEQSSGLAVISADHL